MAVIQSLAVMKYKGRVMDTKKLYVLIACEESQAECQAAIAMQWSSYILDDMGKVEKGELKNGY